MIIVATILASNGNIPHDFKMFGCDARPKGVTRSSRYRPTMPVSAHCKDRTGIASYKPQQQQQQQLA